MKDNNEGADTNGKLMEQFSKAQGSSQSAGKKWETTSTAGHCRSTEPV